MAQSEIKKIIRQLKKKEIRVFDVPEEYKNDIQLVTFERKAGFRITGKRGFDIISNSFFVEETLIYLDADGVEQKRGVFLSFDNFDSYFDFLNGDIYDDACYTFCPFSRISISKKNNAKTLMARKAFIEDTIDDYSLSLSNEEKKNYANFKLKELEIISILDEKIKGKDKKYIENVRKNFDPFLGNGNIVKVRLTEEGDSLLKSFTNYRPKLIKKEGDIYYFEVANENAKLYFRQFSKEAEILEPKSLREEIKNEYLEVLELYK